MTQMATYPDDVLMIHPEYAVLIMNRDCDVGLFMNPNGDTDVQVIILDCDVLIMAPDFVVLFMNPNVLCFSRILILLF